MISVAAPWVLGTAIAGAVVTCVLHFLSVRRPPTLVLPTMRFLPDRPVRAVSRSARPSDLWLLLLRVAALLLAGIGMAGISWSDSRVSRGRVVIIDRNGVSVDAASLREQATAILRDNTRSGDATQRSSVATRVVLLDSTAHVLSASETRAFKPETLSLSHASFTLSATLLASVRAAGDLIRDESQIDSVELDIVSPFPQSDDDAALKSARQLWPGAISLTDVAVAPTKDSAAASVRVKFVGATPNSAVLSALATPAVAEGNPNVRDVSVEWPANGVPSGWSSQVPDTVGAIVTSGQALVWPFIRTARVPDSLARTSRAIAWWSDGRVAAIERVNGNGCTRQVAAVVSSSTDALQGHAARALLNALTTACGMRLSAAQISASTRELLAGKGGAAAATAFRSDGTRRTPFGSVLLLLALVLLSLEWWIRDRERAAVAVVGDKSPLRKVA